MIQGKKFLHIFDDAIIGQSTIELFDKLEFAQKFIVISLNTDRWSAFAADKSNVRILDYYKENVVKELESEIRESDIIFAQALSYEKAKAMARSKKSNKVFIWGLWGYGLYNIVSYFKGEADEYRTTLNQKKGALSRIKEHYTFNYIYKRAVKKLDICNFLLEHDFNLLKESIPNDAKWRTACYQTIENLTGGNIDFTIKGDSILLGNSSTPSNRHELAIDILRKSKVERKIIAPLNYGDENYKERIIKLGKNALGKKFVPLTEFIKLEEYTGMIQECSHVIMPHKRQQAFGTIMMMIYGGSKLYLSEEGPLYFWLKEMGITVFSIEKDLSTEIKFELMDSQKRANREIVSNFLSEKSILERIEILMEDAIQISKSRSLEKA